MKLIIAAATLACLCGAQELELKDDAGKAIVKYVVEAPPSSKTSDPAQQLGLFLCFQEHDTPTGNDIFPVRQALLRQGALGKYVLLAAAPQGRKFGPADHEPIEKLIAWAMKTYPINPRRVYMFGKGEGSKISMEFTMTHPNLVTAAIGYSWGAWLMPSELKDPIDFENKAPEIYLTLGRRDLDNHLTCVRDAYLRLREKGYHFIHREFDELNDRSYHPVSNDDALTWATRLRNKNIAPSPAEAKLLKAPVIANGYYPGLSLVGGAAGGSRSRNAFRFERSGHSRRRSRNLSAWNLRRLHHRGSREAYGRLVGSGAPGRHSRAGYVRQLAISGGANCTDPTRHEYERQSGRSRQRHRCAGVCGAPPGEGHSAGSADVPGAGLAAQR
jgi:hypothetical protein